mgnify:CR=1 FL=1
MDLLVVAQDFEKPIAFMVGFCIDETICNGNEKVSQLWLIWPYDSQHKHRYILPSVFGTMTIKLNNMAFEDGMSKPH